MKFELKVNLSFDTKEEIIIECLTTRNITLDELNTGLITGLKALILDEIADGPEFENIKIDVNLITGQ